MLASFRNRFGIPGVISVIALVFAMFGGAYAASDDGDPGKADASAKAKKGPRGPKGPKGPKGDTGPAGPAGPAGAKGDTGAAGSNGSNGSDGTDGTDGTDGKTILSGTATPTAAVGTLGDFYIETDVSKIYGPKAGSGANGGWGTGTELKGEEGSPWTDGGTLPVGESETGTWSVNQNAVTVSALFPTPISFPIPLPAPVDAVYLNAEETANEAETGGCKWEQDNSSAKPEAPEGTLCVFEELSERVGNAPGFLFFASPGNPAGGTAGPAGIYAWFFLEGTPGTGPGETGPATLNLAGTWAVTAGPAGP